MFRLTTDVKAFEHALAKMPGALQKATARTLTGMARQAHAGQVTNIKNRFIVRAPYTLKSIRTYPAGESKPIARQNAITGTFSPYLAIHDDGGTIRAQNKKIPIPTNVLRGKDRRRKISPQFRMNRLGKLGGSGSRFFQLKGKGIFFRRGRKLIKIRSTTISSYRVKAARWHSDAVRKAGTQKNANRIFMKVAGRVLKGIK
jgi:hypothetical protein